MAYRLDIRLNKSVAVALIFLLLVYYILHYLQSLAIAPEWFRFHGKDLIFIPVLLLSTKGASALAGHRIHLGGKQIAAAVIYAIVVFEWLLPVLSKKYVGDWVDVGAYAAGAGVFYLISKAPLKIKAVSEGR